jgi:cytoskeletal protein CcmA (bactofilin family)
MVAGAIDGNVQARGRFEITSTGVVNGDVTSSVITIEEGAVLEGTSKMTRPNREAADNKDSNAKKEKKSLSAMF